MGVDEYRKLELKWQLNWVQCIYVFVCEWRNSQYLCFANWTLFERTFSWSCTIFRSSFRLTITCHWRRANHPVALILGRTVRLCSLQAWRNLTSLYCRNLFVLHWQRLHIAFIQCSQNFDIPSSELDICPRPRIGGSGEYISLFCTEFDGISSRFKLSLRYAPNE